MEKIYVLSLRHTEDGAWDENDVIETIIMAASHSKDKLIEKVYEWFRDRIDENADDCGYWEDDKSRFYFELEGTNGDYFDIEEIDLI